MKWNSRAIMWPCKDCGCEVAPVRNGKRHTWGVNDKLWKQAGRKLQGKGPFGTGGFLWWTCFVARLESRRGRPFEPHEVVVRSGGYSTNVWVSKKRMAQMAPAPA